MSALLAPLTGESEQHVSGASGWAHYPGLDPTGPTVILEAFGTAQPPLYARDDDHREDLYSIFRARSELLLWGDRADHSRRLWGMEEAEMDHGGSTRVGWVQVGLEYDVEVAGALVPLLRCLEDSVRRLGATDLTGFSVTVIRAATKSSLLGDLISGLNWFDAVPAVGVVAEVVLDDGSLDLAPAVLSRRFRGLNTGPFTFRSESASDPRPALRPGEIPILAILPEWSSEAAAFALALVLETARSEADRKGGERSEGRQVSFVARIHRQSDYR